MNQGEKSTAAFLPATTYDMITAGSVVRRCLPVRFLNQHEVGLLLVEPRKKLIINKGGGSSHVVRKDLNLRFRGLVWQGPS